MNFKSIGYSFWIVLLISIIIGLWIPVWSFAEEVEIDTGIIKVICGRDKGGFIDEVYLDSNEDGTYSDDELIVLRPDDQAGLLVSYTELKKRVDRSGVAVGPAVQGNVRVNKARVENLDAVIEGMLDFGMHGTSAFETRIQARKKIAVLIIDFDFEPIRNSDNLLLRDAALRIFGVFDKSKPKKRLRSMSTGEFRNTPRPDRKNQYMVWQYGGHLVESPWYWRNWLSWSKTTGPKTTHEGHTPSEDLTFFMHDNFHGIQVAIKEPSHAAPIELSGSGYPSILSIHAWTPRVQGLSLNRDVPAQFHMNGAAIHFFKTDLKKSVKNERRYNKKKKEVIESSKKELLSIAKPVVSNLRDLRIPDRLHAERIDSLSNMKARGWDANVASVDTSFSPVLKSNDLPYGNNWLKVVLDAPAGVTGKNVPASGGLPFPRGEVNSVKHIRLIDSDGKEVACQVERLAMWPDGSVKWALITALVEIRQGDKQELRIEYGPDVYRRSMIEGKINIQQSTESMLVDNGVIRFAIKKSGTGIFDTLWFDRNGDGTYRDNEQVFSGEGNVRRNRMDLVAFKKRAGYGPYMYHTDTAELEQSAAKVEEIEIERQGPLTANILVKGRYHYRKLGRGRQKGYENKGNEFWIRFTVYADQPYIGIKHSYVFDGNPDLEMIRDLRLSAAPNLGKDRVFTASMDNEVFKLVMQGTASSAGTIQDNPHSGELWISGQSGRNEEVKHIARKSDGWADISDGTWGVTFGVRNMREMYAKGLSVEDGLIEISLWPERARYLDTRRYSRQFVSGESTSYGQGAAQGISRSHDTFFYFHEGGAKEAESGTVANYLLQRVFIKAYPEWYGKTEAAGFFNAFDTTNNKKWEMMLQDGLEYFLYHQKLWTWYGVYDYGDFQQRPTWRGWQQLNGRWGWVNNEALVDMWIYEQFFRTGKREYLDAALALSRHTLEVDVINSDTYKGSSQVKMRGHRHNVDHWGDGYVGIRVAAPQGFRLGYFLTGDLRIYDQLKMSMEAHWDSVHGYDKQHATGLGLLIFFWETTGDDIYRKALDAYLDYQVAHFKKFGHIHHGKWKFRKNQGKTPGNKPLSGPPINIFFQNFGTAYSLMELAELTGRTDLVEALIGFARSTVKVSTGTWQSKYSHYRLMGFAYRHTGDRIFLEHADKGSKELKVIDDRKKWSNKPAIHYFTNKLSMLAWTGQGLPYLMKAIELRKDYPVSSFRVPRFVKMPADKTMASLPVDGNGSKAMDGEIQGYEWWAGGKKLSEKPVDTLELPPGLHRISLWVSDNRERRSMSEEKVTVWKPGVIARLCFKSKPDGFMLKRAYDEEHGYGYLPGTTIRRTLEPRMYGDKGCKEVHISGTVQVKTGPGVFNVEMGGRDFWTERMGSISLQGKTLDIKVKKDSEKKIEWGYSGEVKVDEDGLLKIDFIKGSKGEPVVLAYIIVRKYER
jgi:hypothetical protein